MGTVRLTMNPASEGDALILSWGEPAALRHALIDLGRTGDYRALRERLKAIGRFELFTISHIDADHIEGAMPLMKETTAPFAPADVWFNAYHHLRNAANRRDHAEERETLSALQGEKFSAGILRFRWPWNTAFGGDIVSVDSPEAGAPLPLAGGMALRLLSPTDTTLAALAPGWLRELEKANLRPLDPDEERYQEPDDDHEALSGLNVEHLAAQRFVADTAPPNGSSIAFLAECDGRRLLLGADAHSGVLEASLRAPGANESSPLKLDCFKLSHHGSRANTSHALLRIVDCTCFAISTDGTRHGHPDAETIARILMNDRERMKTLVFNFVQPGTTIWNDAALMNRYRYRCVFPLAGEAGVAIDL